MPRYIDAEGRSTSYESHEVLPADYFGPVEPEPVVEPEPQPEPEPAAQRARSGRTPRARAAKPAAAKPEAEHPHRLSTTTETQGAVQQTRLTVDKPEEPEDAPSGGNTGGQEHSNHHD